MSETVDRVALALSRDALDGYLEGYKRTSIDEMNPEELRIARRGARAAIEAMREPTWDMEMAFWRAYHAGKSGKQSFSVMIDEALK